MEGVWGCNHIYNIAICACLHLISQRRDNTAYVFFCYLQSLARRAQWQVNDIGSMGATGFL